MPHLDQLIQADPDLINRRMRIERQVQEYVRTHPNGSPEKAIITIPVVVHVVYNPNVDPAGNISMSQIQSQLDVLNADFAAPTMINPETGFTVGQVPDTEIRFCLAQRDPQGNPTDGVIRFETTLGPIGEPEIQSNAMKVSPTGSPGWPQADYMNIWVVNMAAGGTLGYASFPGTEPDGLDGMVIGHKFFGTNGTVQAPIDGGRTTTHEVGHWLNLIHIWGDQTDCSGDDMVGDTPGQAGPFYGCPATPAQAQMTCGSRDLVENYMNYSDDACMQLFTPGQITRMQAALAASPRSAIANSQGCVPPSTATCTDGIQNGDETGVDCGGSCPNPCPVACQTPTNTASQRIFYGYAAAVSWDPVQDAQYYTTQVRERNRGWITVHTPFNFAFFVPLNPHRSYEWRVRTICNDGSTSDWTSILNLAGSGSRLSTSSLNEPLSLYPNPAQDVIQGTINPTPRLEGELRIVKELGDIEINTSPIEISILDLQGRTLNQQALEFGQGDFAFDISSLATGIYIIKAKNEDGFCKPRNLLNKNNNSY